MLDFGVILKLWHYRVPFDKFDKLITKFGVPVDRNDHDHQERRQERRRPPDMNNLAKELSSIDSIFPPKLCV